MRIKDENKQHAIFEATVKMVNEIGFASSSVSKIAKEAEVSPATIYIYYKNKEDLLVSTYIFIKKELGCALLEGFDDTLPIRDILNKVWQNMFKYISNHPSYFNFTEQFSNSPYSEMVNQDEVQKSFEPVMKILQNGIERKIIKNVNFDLLTAFIFYPILTLSNSRLCKNIEVDEKMIGEAFSMAWDAIKL
jgi:AcrR family transcriptional regulator